MGKAAGARCAVPLPSRLDYEQPEKARTVPAAVVFPGVTVKPLILAGFGADVVHPGAMPSRS